MPLPWSFLFFCVFLSFFCVMLFFSFVALSSDTSANSNIKISNLILPW